MTNIEKDIAEDILRASGSSPSRLGLRFDRVVVRLLGELRFFAEAEAPPGVALVVTVTAPIRLPARTAAELKQALAGLLSAPLPCPDRRLTIQGNAVRLRRVDHAPDPAPRLIGFVHNPGSAPEVLLDLAEGWLRGRTPVERC